MMKTIAATLGNLMKRKIVIPHAALLAMAFVWLLPAADVLASTLRVNYTINYYPPNPCNMTWLGDSTLEGTELKGTLKLYSRTMDDRLEPTELVSRAHPPNPCGVNQEGTFSFDYNPLVSPAIYVSLAGEITHPPDPGHPPEPGHPFYAFPEGTTTDSRIVQTDPGSAEPILLRMGDDSGPSAGRTLLPLFAFASPGVEIGSLSIEVTPVDEITVSIDIKPGSTPNSINVGSSGVIPVAILSSDNFSAPERIDANTISLAGAKVKMVGKSAKHLCHSEDVNADGLVDLVCQVETVQFLIDQGESKAVLEAQTYDGTPVRGEDSVRIVP